MTSGVMSPEPPEVARTLGERNASVLGGRSAWRCRRAPNSRRPSVNLCPYGASVSTSTTNFPSNPSWSAESAPGASSNRAGLNEAQLTQAYHVALETRAAIIQCMTMKGRGEGVEFWIGGPGEEVHGTATALALHHVIREDAKEPGDLGLFLHYRSDALASMNLAL